MHRYRLTIAYEGGGFHGWQKQWATGPHAGGARLAAPDTPDPVARPPLRTVQHVVEQSVRAVVRAPIELLGASRTDAGVHALSQTAAFSCAHDTPRPPDERLAMAINARLPEDVFIRDCRPTRDEFDPISDCTAKGYRYLLDDGPERPLFRRRTVHHLHRPIDVDAMNAAAEALVGEHDFAAFTSAGHGRASTVRRVLSCDAHRLDPRTVAIDVSSEGFLYNMVRIIAGTLVEIGQGRSGADRLAQALEAGERRLAGPTLPPEGLCLRWVRYPDDELEHPGGPRYVETMFPDAPDDPPIGGAGAHDTGE